MAMEADMRVKVFIIVQHFYEDYFLPFTSETDEFAPGKIISTPEAAKCEVVIYI
jgi:hypothetical protein